MKKAFLLFAVLLTTFFSIGSGVNNLDKQAENLANNETVEQSVVKSKEEVIYANLNYAGDVANIYVVNIFDVSKGGMISDYGNYSSLKNLTNTNDISYENNNIKVSSDSGNFYYQGDLIVKELPWNLSIKYLLDGAAITPQQLSGSSGHLVIELTSSKNETINSFFYDNYLLQISFTLSVLKATNIVSNSGIVANSGKNKLINCTVMPKNNANIVIEADVNNFSMAGIDIAAIPMSMDIEIPNTTNIKDEFNELIEAVEDFSEGVDQMSEASDNMKQGIYGLLNGSVDFSQGLNALASNFNTILNGSSEMKNGLNTLAGSVTGLGSMLDLSSIEALLTGLTTIAGGLTTMSAGLTSLKDGFNLAYTALDASIDAIPECDISESELEILLASNPTSAELIGKLSSFYSNACTVKGTYTSVEPAFAAIGPGLDEVIYNLGEIIASLNFLATNVENAFGDEDYGAMLSLLETSIATIANNYNLFHQGLGAYYAGLNQLVGGYSDFNSGLSELYLGNVEFYNGMLELNDGVLQLLEGVEILPQKMQEKIDELVSEYNKEDLEYISFVNQENENVKSVQFVLKSAKIEEKVIVRPDDEEKDKDNKDTFWSRLIALFKLNS